MRVFWIVLAALGCGSPSDTECRIEPLGLQPTKRFPVGETFWLPELGEGCLDTWTLQEGGPGGPIQGQDGYWRFTPSEAGRWVFAIPGHQVTLNAVDEVPFHNLNHYPTRSMARVGEELWVTEVSAPRVARLDLDTLESLGAIRVGAWPVAIAAHEQTVVVAHRGSDTLGFVDPSRDRIVDAVWVGDEPSNVRLSPDGSRAYVALSTEGAIAVVDTRTRTVIDRFDALRDVSGLDLSADGNTLWVAPRRSSQADRHPFATDAAMTDLMALDAMTGDVQLRIDEIGTTLGDVLVDGDVVYLAGTRVNTLANLAQLDENTFTHFVQRRDAGTGDLLADADLSRQEGSGGWAVQLTGLARVGDSLWVTAEGSDQTLELDAESLAERSRFDSPGRPRALYSDGETLYAHGHGEMTVTRVSAGTTLERVTGPDPRPADVAAGQAFFSGAAVGYGANHSCAGCHPDGLTDGVVWKTGPFEEWRNTRPWFWLAGTAPMGWSGYANNVRISGYAGGTTIDYNPTTTESEELTAFLRSLQPPARANHLTRRDGSLSDAARSGEALFQSAGCVACHAGPLGTSRQVLEDGVTPEVSDVPTLVGSYRHGTWLKTGEARTLRDAVARVAETYAPQLGEAEIDDLTRYVGEITARDFFPLVAEPDLTNGALPVDASISLTWSAPVLNTSDNLARIRLVDDNGQPVDALVSAEGHTVDLVPAQVLEREATYRVEIDATFEAFDERILGTAQAFTWTTPAAASLFLDGDYEWIADIPAIDFVNDGFDLENTLPVMTPIQASASASGATLIFDFGEDILFESTALIDGTALTVPPVPLNTGIALASTDGFEAALVDEDGDGIADSASGTVRLSGPGMDVEAVTWRLQRPSTAVCTPGNTGPFTVDVLTDGSGGAEISWDGTNALALYVTDPGAFLPLGPGVPVSGGTTFWALATVAFPAGFSGPVTYGQVPDGASDDSQTHAAALGGASLEPGRCYQISVVTNTFQTGTFTLVYPEPS